jgi:Zn-dependent alcohol dehydrogenase
MSTHNAVATVAIRAPLEIMKVPTIRPVGREVRVRMEWTASTPLDLHQNDSGLLVKHPQILGDGVAGTVVEVGDMVRRLAIGDQVSNRKFASNRKYQTNSTKVFGFCFEEAKCKAQQEYVTVAETSLSKVISKQ